MTDYSAEGALPVDHDAPDDLPTEEEVRAAQQEKYPEQASTQWDAAEREESDEAQG
jgi:hypothetical protein